ncbi:hypothetical protein COV12_02055 [Candidatus Woesearchaeota archaeon CG10_big_fil_rev_8_21_14_0_10_32_24]|nr:MAG: hypothetical protein COV12_02055 [Candidatus Woesearchaeota archaeon CG10_big_fil_rev_8_21_14_0_10_32_24]
MKKNKQEYETNETLVVVEERVGNTPEKKFRAGAVSATVWANRGQNQQGEPTEYKTISLERNYTDKEGKWQSTNSFRVNDLPKAKLVLEKAYEFLVLSA